jgi:hypothetical protein
MFSSNFSRLLSPPPRLLGTLPRGGNIGVREQAGGGERGGATGSGLEPGGQAAEGALHK